MLYKKLKKGFTLLEILLSIAIVMMVGTLILVGFNTLNKRQALDKDILLVTSILNEARSLTLSSKESSQYGVYLDSYEVVLFKGSSYDPNDANNKATPLSLYSRLYSLSMSSSGSDIIFRRLTGAATRYGTITYVLRSDSNVSRVISVSETGVVEAN